MTRVRNRITRLPETCGRCKGPCPVQFRYCDGCSLPATVRRRTASVGHSSNPGVVSQLQERAAATLELSPYSQRIEDAIADLEKHASRALKLAIDADAGVRPLRATKRPHAAATAGARTGTHQESSDG